MKVQNTRPVLKGDVRRLSNKKQSPFTPHESSHVASIGPSSAPLEVLSLQEVNAPSPHQEHVQRGKNLLDCLEKMRIHLLHGHPRQDTIEKLRETLKQSRERCPDPKVEEVLSLIEQRSEIEIAKASKKTI